MHEDLICPGFGVSSVTSGTLDLSPEQRGYARGSQERFQEGVHLLTLWSEEAQCDRETAADGLNRGYGGEW